MPPDENDGGQGQGLAMLRLEARRYKREMQQIWMQRELHEKRKSTASFSSEDSSRNPDRWRFAETFTTSPATSGTPMFWNREDVAVSHFQQLAIVEEGTQTDTPSKSEVQTETEKQQYGADGVLDTGKSRTTPSAADDLSMSNTCSMQCDELRSRISQEGAAVRVNADVMFTAKPKRVAVETQVETLVYKYSNFFRADEKGTVSQISTMQTSPPGSLNKGQISTDPVEYYRTGLRSLVSPVPQHDRACSPIYNLHDYGARFKSLRDTYKDSTPSDMFSWQQDRSEPERCSSFPPATFPTQVSTPPPEASFGGTKAGDNTSDVFAEMDGSRRVSTELRGEGAMAARLATKIIHALEAIGGKGDTHSLESTFNLPGPAIQSISACKSLLKDGSPEMEFLEEAGDTVGGATLNDNEIASSDSSLPSASQHARRVAVTSQNHSSRMPASDADVYFQNVMAALSIERYTSNKHTAEEVNPASAVRRTEASRRILNTKSCGDHHASHQCDDLKRSVKKDVRQSGSNHVKEKQRLLLNVQKLQSVAETAKKLYTDLVDCAFDEIGASTDCGKRIKHQDEDDARDVCKFSRPINEICSQMEKTSDRRTGGVPTSTDEVCGRCHVCQPQNTSRANHPKCAGDSAPSNCRNSRDSKQPPEEAQTDSPGEITIELSGDSTSNIRLSKNDCTNRPGYDVEIFNPDEAPCKPAMRRTGSNQQAKICPNKCLLDPCCDGPRNSCHMPTRSKCSGASIVCISPPKKNLNNCRLNPRPVGPRNSHRMPTRSKCSGASTVSISSAVEGSNECRLDPCCVGSRNSCHMPTYAKSSRAASCGPDGGSRFKRNNGTKLHNKDPSVLPLHCLVHCRRGVEFTKGKLEKSPCHGKVRSSRNVHREVLHDKIPGHTLLLERKERSPGRPCRDISKFQKGRLDDNSIEMPLSGSRNHRDLRMIHDEIWNSSLKGKENGYRFHDELAGPHYSSSVNTPPRNVHRSFAECSRNGGIRNLPTLTATEVIERKRASVGKKTRQPPKQGRCMSGNASGLSEPYTKSIPPHRPPLNHVDRAAAAAELAKEIEEMMADQLDKSNRRIRESNSLTSRRIVPDVKNELFGQSNSDVGAIAAANAVKKLKPVSLLPVGKRSKGNQRVTLRKGPKSKVKFVAKDASGNDFYEQMRKELEELRLRSTSPAKDHSSKLLRLNVGNAESQAGRMKKDLHPDILTNRVSSSFGRWKPLPGKGQSKTTTKRKIFTTRKTRPPAWVERMYKAKDTSLLRPMLLAQSRKEKQSRPSFRMRNLQPPGMMFTSSVSSKQSFGNHIPAGSEFRPNVLRKERKNPTTPIQYDINTGRKIVHSEREPGERLPTRVEKHGVFPSFKSLDEKNIRISRRPIVKVGILHPVVTNSARYHLRVTGWNPDPLIRSDIPHKPADIIRYNRNGGLDVQVRRRDADSKHSMLAGNSGGRRNVRQVTFAGMFVHNSRNERRTKSSRAPHRSDSLQGQVTNKKLITSQSRKVKSASRNRRSTTATKMQPIRDRDKLHRYGGGVGHWTYHEGFWTETFKPEKESQDDSLRSGTTPGSMSQLDTPILEMESAHIIKNEKPMESAGRVGAEEFLATVSSLAVVKSLDDEDPTSMAGENIALEGDGVSQNPDLFKNLSSFGSDILTGGGNIDHGTVVALKGLLCPSRRNEEDERAEPCSEVELKFMAKKKVQVSKIASTCQERQKREPSYKVQPQSPLRLSEEVFPDSTENETLVSMFDHLQESTSVQIEVQSDDASECITRQDFFARLAHDQEGNLKEIELERTLMDIVLHTILQDDPLQDKEVLATRAEPISLPTNMRLCRTGMRADKEVEAVVHSHDRSQSPLSNAVPCVDRSTEHDIVPHVDRATELDVVPHIDSATELDNSLFSKNQDSQTTKDEILVPNNQRLTSRTQEECSAKVKDVCCALHHRQPTECRATWSTVGVQTPDTTTTISSPPAAMPMLMPVLFQQWGTSIFPTILPTVHFELPVTMPVPSNVHPPPAGAVLPIGVDQGTQATECHIRLKPKEMAVQVHHQVPKFPINTRGAREELGVLEEESDSDFEELKGGSSPSTPSTPLSSPAHKKSLRKAMDLYPVNSSLRENIFPRNDLQPSTSAALVSDLVPQTQMVTDTILEDVTANETPETMTSIETRRGTSWAKVKEMEAATLSLLRAASRQSPSATSSSEYSGELSPELHTWISPGELNIEEVGRSSTGGRFFNNAYNTRTFQEALCKPAQSCAWSSFNSGRASVGEINNPIRFLGLSSEGEVEAGVVPTLDEPGQIPIGYDFAMHSRADLQGQGSEPGELHDASSH